jgi:hypothetical protein
MKMINKFKLMEVFLVTGLLVVMLSSLVSAVGVGSGYSPDTPLEMYPGEERIILLTLQNTDVEEEVTVEGKILEGSEIASLTENIFKVQYQSTSVSAKMKMELPEDASVGQSYLVRYEFGHVSAVGEGVEGTGVAFSQGVTRSFNVVVVEKPEEEKPAGIGTGWTLLIIILIVVVIAVIYFITKKKTSVEPVKKQK